MSPLVFWSGEFKFFFFSKEESRKHVHVWSPKGQAKFWIEPIVALADFQGKISKKELKELEQIVKERFGEIEKAWDKHFKTSNSNRDR